MKRTRVALLVLLLATAPAVLHSQNAYSTNTDGSIYAYTTNSDGSANIAAYTGPPWNVTIPTNINGLTVSSIGIGAFQQDSLNSITIPGSVISIGGTAFYNCTSLTNATIYNGVTTIGFNAFYGSALTSVTIPGSVTSIQSRAFFECPRLASVTIPGSVTNIGQSAFSDSGMTNVTIEDGVTNTGQDTFAVCNKLTSVTIPDSITSIGMGAFTSCSSLASLTIPGSVTNIGQSAFYSCKVLTNVTLGNSVAAIEDYAFEECFELTSVYIQGDAPMADSTVFQSDNFATVYYLTNTTGWSNTFANRPAVLWCPLIQSGGASFGVQSNQFGFNITNGGTNNIPIAVQACNNLASPVWTPLQTLTLTNSFYFSEPLQSNSPGRFYRISSP